MILLKYEHDDISFFGDGEHETTYTLTIQKSFLFGLIKIDREIEYRVSMFGDLESYHKHWDNMIENKTKFSKQR